MEIHTLGTLADASAQAICWLEAERVWLRGSDHAPPPTDRAAWVHKSFASTGRVVPAKPGEPVLWGTARVAKQGEDPPGVVAGGPLWLLPPGRYVAEAWLWIDPGQAPGPVVALEVFGRHGQQRLGGLTVGARELGAAPAHWRLGVTVATPEIVNDFEVVVRWFGAGAVGYLKSSCARLPR